jgi:hypothetical protein
LSNTTSDEKAPVRPKGVRSCVIGFRTSEGSDAAHGGNRSNAKKNEMKRIDAILRQRISPVKSIIPVLVGLSSSLLPLKKHLNSYKKFLKS